MRTRRSRPSFVAAVVVVLRVGLGARAEAKLRVVASIETLADLSRQVGGDRVDVTSLSRGYQDPHFVEAKPSLVLALNRADALVYVGLDLEVGWLPPLVQQSRNGRIQRGQPGNIDASSAIRPEDVPNVAVRSAARARRHPPARQPALLDPAQERARHRAPARRAAHRARRRRRGHLPGRARRASRRSSPRKEKEWEAAAAPLRGHAHRHVPQELVVRGALAGPGGGRLHRAQARHPADRRTTPRSSSS